MEVGWGDPVGKQAELTSMTNRIIRISPLVLLLLLNTLF